MICKFFWAFWRDGWNIFDIVVVLFSVFALVSVDLPPELSVLRTLRVFRAARLFARNKDMRIIVNSIIGSIRPVLFSVLIFLLVTAMFAVVGKQLFYKKHPMDFYNFAHSMFTMYQVATGMTFFRESVYLKIHISAEQHAITC